jgi:hypothetical protein
MSAPRITIEPLGVYDTHVLEDALGPTLWGKVSPKLPKLCKGIVMGEDVLRILRDIAKREIDQRPLAGRKKRPARIPSSAKPTAEIRSIRVRTQEGGPC